MESVTEKIKIGTRKSPLAVAQTSLVVEKLKSRNPERGFEIHKIKTEGDEDYKLELGNSTTGKDAFTKRIEQRLLSGQIDIAVHSLKDLPSNLHPELIIGAIPERADPRDVLVSIDHVRLRDLPAGARVGTSSLRRRVQLVAYRSDLEVVDLHGNIGTRIAKMRETGLNAIVLALAGLIRLGMKEQITEILPTEIMLPAIGQGALAVQVRKHDTVIRKIVQSIDDANTRLATEAERAFSERLGGGCNLPLAAHGKVNGGRLGLEGMVASVTSRRMIREMVLGDAGNPSKLGGQLAERMLALGAGEMMGESH